jgi:hypothetical protein
MKTRTSVLTLALYFVAGAICFASDAQIGTWKLKRGKSKLASGMPKNNTVVYVAEGDIKVTIEHVPNICSRISYVKAKDVVSIRSWFINNHLASRCSIS